MKTLRLAIGTDRIAGKVAPLTLEQIAEMTSQEYSIVPLDGEEFDGCPLALIVKRDPPLDSPDAPNHIATAMIRAAGVRGRKFRVFGDAYLLAVERDEDGQAAPVPCQPDGEDIARLNLILSVMLNSGDKYDYIDDTPGCDCPVCMSAQADMDRLAAQREDGRRLAE